MRQLRYLLSLYICVMGGACCSPKPTTQSSTAATLPAKPITVTLTIKPVSSIDSHSPLLATVAIENSGNNLVWIEDSDSRSGDWEVGCIFRGHPFPLREDFVVGNSSRSLDTVRVLEPASHESATLDLRKLFDFTEPGKYTFSFRRAVGMDPADRSKRVKWFSAILTVTIQGGSEAGGETGS